MANYKLITSEPTGVTSQLVFQAGATNTVVASVTAHATATSDVLEVLIKKNGGSAIEIAKKTAASATTPEEMLTAPVALEALDELFVRTSRTGAKFVVTYVEETDVANDTALGGLADVDTTGVSDGDALVYNATNSQWEPAVVSGGGGGSSTLDGLTDTNISSPVSGNLLRWNGSDWANASATTSIIVEGTNLYYTDARVDARIAADTTKADASHTHTLADITDSGTAAALDVAASGDAAAGEVVKGDDTRLTDARTPTSHTHTASEITDFDTEVSNNTTVTNNSAVAAAAFAASNTNTSNLQNLTSSIQNHTDVVLSQAVPANLPDDVFLQWNAANTRWEDHVLTLGDNDNVDLTTTAPTNGDILEFDGTNFVPVAPTAVPSSIDNLTDVDTSTASPSTGDILEWDGSNWVPATPSTGGGSNVHDTDTTLTNAGDYDSGADIMDYTTLASGTTISGGKPYGLGPNGWTIATNAGSSANSLIAVAASGQTDGSAMVIRGLVRASDSLSAASVGDPVYLGTGSKWTLTAPTSGATVVQLGRVIDPSNNVVWFDPDKTTLTLQ